MIATAIVLSGLLAASSASPRLPFELEIRAAIADAAGVYPVPKALVLAVISVESAFDPHAVSRAGAVGLMQLMPATAQRVGIARDELANPRRNIIGGVRLLAVLLRHYEGDVVSSLVAYNARPRRLFARVPQNGETPEYVRRVLSRTRWYSRSAEPGAPVRAFRSTLRAVMRSPPRPAPPPLDAKTLEHAVAVLEERLLSVETYGAGGCPTCHDAELRGAVAKLRELNAIAVRDRAADT